jgi:hypothetical protein
MFRASLCPSSGEQEKDWLKLHVKMPGCAGCGCVEPWCTQCALSESKSFDDGHDDARNMLRLI